MVGEDVDENDAIDVFIAQASLILQQPPSVIRQENMRDLEFVYVVKMAQLEREEREIKDSQNGSSPSIFKSGVGTV